MYTYIYKRTKQIRESNMFTRSRNTKQALSYNSDVQSLNHDELSQHGKTRRFKAVSKNACIYDLAVESIINQESDINFLRGI